MQDPLPTRLGSLHPSLSLALKLASICFRVSYEQVTHVWLVGDVQTGALTLISICPDAVAVDGRIESVNHAAERVDVVCALRLCLSRRSCRATGAVYRGHPKVSARIHPHSNHGRSCWTADLTNSLPVQSCIYVS